MESEHRKHPFIIREQFSVDEGPVIIVFPDRLSKESSGFVAEWLALVSRKLLRWAENSDVGGASTQAQGLK